MTITLSSLKVKNFRSCADVELSLSRFTALVGYNNSGKSNIISAITWLLKKYSLTEQDFFDISQPVEIEAIFSDIDQLDIDLLPENQRRQVEPYIECKKIRARRVQLRPYARPAEIKFEIFDSHQSEWRNNPAGIDAALSVLFPDPISIGAMEDAAEDATKAKTTTTIGKLLAEFTRSIQSGHADEINGHLQKVSDRLASSGQHRIRELSIIDQQINEKLQDVFPGVSIKLHFDVPTVADLIKAGTIKVAEGGGRERDITFFGHGTQRSIQMTLIRHLAEVKRGDVLGGTTLLLIDEPELYMHPFAIEQVRSALKKLSNDRYQVIFSTHSAQMIEASDAQNTLHVRKNDAGKTMLRKRLKDAIDIVVPNAVHQIEHLFSLSNSSQFLFSDSVLVTEGKTEKKLLPHIFQSVKGRTFGQMKIALIALDGVGNLNKTIAILRGMDLPAKAIVDLDYAFRGAIDEGILLATDTDISALKKQLERMESRLELNLDSATRLPVKGVQGSAAKGFELLAADAASAAHIERLHAKLRLHNIWLWTKGSFEPHLGIRNKTEHAWAEYMNTVSTHGFEKACSGDPKTMGVLDWICGK